MLNYTYEKRGKPVAVPLCDSQEVASGRVAEGGGLLNRYRVVKPYRGFESLRLRQIFAAARRAIRQPSAIRWPACARHLSGAFIPIRLLHDGQPQRRDVGRA